MGRLRAIINRNIIPIVYYVFICTITSIYSILFIFWFLYKLIRNPTKKIWTVKHRELPPNCLNDPVYGNHRYSQTKNVKLHYVEAGNKENPLIIFLHGFPDFWYSWRHQIKEFSKDFWTVAIDLRGYGDSEKPDGKQNYRPVCVTEDIKNLLECLGREKCILIGHDWGGFITWRFAQCYPEKLEKYIVINAPEQTVFWKYISTSFDQFKRSWYIFFFQSPYLPELAIRMNDMSVMDKMHRSNEGISFITEEDLEAYKFTFGKPGALTPPLNYYRTIMSRILPMKGLVNNKRLLEKPITKPGLMIISDNDTALSKDLLMNSAKKVGGDHVKITVINNATHFVHQEKPEEVNMVLSNFIRAI